MKFWYDFFGHGLVVFMVLFTTLGAYAQPSWVTGYPQILSGATSVDIKALTDSNGIIYFAIYKTAQTGITSTQLKNDALVGTNPNLVKRGSVAITSNTLQTIKQTALTQNTTYYIYVVAESIGGLMADNKINFTSRFFPKRQQEFYNYSNAAMNSYLMYFPEDYYKSTATYPLLVFLGGAGELSRGGVPNPNRLLDTGLPQVINLGKDVPMIVASPQGIWSWNGAQTSIDAYIEFLKATFRVDATKIFLTGLSDGGEGVLAYANAYAAKVKAIVPVSTWPVGADIHNFINVPVWAFMGSSDTNGYLHQWIDALKVISGNATYTEYPGGHSSSVWNPVYDGSKGADIYQWMLNAVPPPANILPVVNAGTDQSVSLPLPQLQLTGTATDADGTIASLLWTKVSGPAVTMANTTTSILTLTNLLAGTYNFQLRAQDNGGAATTDPITVTVYPAPVVLAREFDINITWAWNKQTSLPWNDFIITNCGVVGNSAVLFDKNGVTSTISLSITAPFQDGVNNHGVIPGLYPSNVMQYYLRSTQTKVGSLKLAGLNTAKKYDVSILSSNVDVWYPSDTRLTVQGQSATVNAKGNANQLVTFVNISPTAIGEIPITVAPATTNSTNVGVINAIILTERGSLPGARTQSPDVVTADHEKLPGDYIRVFPNPVEDYVDLEISSSLPTPETFAIEFVDLRGAQVYARLVESQVGTNSVSERISADFMQSGLYIMAVRSQQIGVQYFKIVKK